MQVASVTAGEFRRGQAGTRPRARDAPKLTCAESVRDVTEHHDELSSGRQRFERFQAIRRSDLRRIAAPTRGEMSADDLTSEAWLIALEIGQRRRLVGARTFMWCVGRADDPLLTATSPPNRVP